MKITPEVVAALAVLRSATENDFERHRLDVLERDLEFIKTADSSYIDQSQIDYSYIDQSQIDYSYIDQSQIGLKRGLRNSSLN